ncbi:hypothetical protein RvY_10613 [Ramazzottius varieornatus]|uniref:Uncharacterized protein n=1 Tax=Ramazzottius varieornatus TaxID=947166 RepID=A0A1D1VFS7_RAMVA|nr:hypothetical protein RvY_10613 [Ramazzottius varieornatus]
MSSKVYTFLYVLKLQGNLLELEHQYGFFYVATSEQSQAIRKYGVSLNVLPLCELYRNFPTPDTTNFFSTKPKNSRAPEAPISSSEETPIPSPFTSPVRPTPTKQRLTLLDSSDEDQASKQPPITPKNTSHTRKTRNPRLKPALETKKQNKTAYHSKLRTRK